MEQKLLNLINQSHDPNEAIITAIAVIELWLSTFSKDN